MLLILHQIAKAVDEEVVARDLVPSFVKLLKDNEAEVRTAIAGQIPGFCALVDRTTLLNEIMGSIEDLVSDSSQHVRAALGTQISGLAPILGKQEYVCSKALPMLSCPLLTLILGPSTISFPCSFRCSRMSSLRFACTSSQSWSWSTKVSLLHSFHEFIANIRSHRNRPALTISAARNRPAGRRQTMACSLGYHRVHPLAGQPTRS